MKHLIPLTIREFRYYERKLPLYLRNDDCFVEHFRLWYELMMGEGDDNMGIAISEFKGVSPTSDLLLYLLNIYDKDFLSIISQLKDYDDNCDLLDMIGNLFGLRRTFSLEYYETATSTTKTAATVSLTDKEFLMLIKAQIIRNYCDGTYEQVMQYYADAGLQILPVYNSTYDASVDAYLNEDKDVTDNISKLFRGGYLTIEHLGIRYTYTITEMVNFLVWADANGQGGNSFWADENDVGGVFVV